MDDGVTTNQYLVISFSIVYFNIASVHLWSNRTSRESSVSSLPLLRGWGFIGETMMNSQQTPNLYGPWVSMHLNEPSLSPPPATQGFLNSLSSKALHQTQYQQLSHFSFNPSPPLSTSTWKPFYTLTFCFLWAALPNQTFICFSWSTHLHFFESPYVICEFVVAPEQQIGKPLLLATLWLSHN